MENKQGKRKVRRGIVLSDKMDKTVIVSVERKYLDPVFRKVVKDKNKYKVHNPENLAKSGDFVEIMETRPLSKDKRWRIVKILKKTTAVKESLEDIPEVLTEEKQS